MNGEETDMAGRLLVAVSTMLWVGVTAAQAHEMRAVGGYTLTVGFRAEPAFEDVVNAVDIFINRTSDGKAISVRDGDVVNLSVEVQLREDDDAEAATLAAALLHEKPRQDFAVSNRYNAWFKPTHDGAYAFRIIGRIADASDPQAGDQAIDETYICGDGTQSSTSRFNCVQDPQTFPGKAPAGYRNNQAFSHE
jgi:uncharacterized protein YggL (DUF469 family)